MYMYAQSRQAFKVVDMQSPAYWASALLLQYVLHLIRCVYVHVHCIHNYTPWKLTLFCRDEFICSSWLWTCKSLPGSCNWWCFPAMEGDKCKSLLSGRFSGLVFCVLFCERYWWTSDILCSWTNMPSLWLTAVLGAANSHWLVTSGRPQVSDFLIHFLWWRRCFQKRTATTNNATCRLCMLEPKDSA